MREIKEPSTPLAGIYGHPTHPIAVKLPIGAFVANLLFDSPRRSQKPRVFARGSAAVAKTGLVGGAAAAFFGYLDSTKIPAGTPAGNTARRRRTSRSTRPRSGSHRISAGASGGCAGRRRATSRSHPANSRSRS
ncbi:hypothetical protein WPS_18540 [Vulcanimicrobium alpinum]|uniref:DUF2231 domain-containing protein n=1 Tax=Vulcanimicrobium alpinum TaxID=3016050 RepID=A0AAN1XYB0_UNVUL|nr:DUF2231 domain-containing protein [Vulcanimicrobium alpinum]BDE06578.1 hypothetical protein WPS_18540 [Vulcanimicrobium alpinum]